MSEGRSIETLVAVIGLGYVGLPVVVSAVTAGYRVIGFDTAEAVVSRLNSGRSHVDDVSDARVMDIVNLGFLATAQPADLADVDIFVICVPTPLSNGGGPDLSAVLAAGRLIAGVLKKGSTVILESTTYPGTTEFELLPLLEESGLKAGVDFALAFSPERIDPGNQTFTFANTPKVVGGLTEYCRANAAKFYRSMVNEVVTTKGLRGAEMTKLLENTYRHVNIALVNEMARFCSGLNIDLWDVIQAAGTKPFGFERFYPGPGVGGHCIPIDPNYLSHFVRSETGYSFRFVELAQEINSSMPAYVASRVQGLLNAEGLPMRDAEILLLGITYKPNIADTRESPAVPIARAFRRMGAHVSFHDPFVPEWQVDGVAVNHTPDLMEGSKASDCVVLLQAHTEFDIEAIVESAKRFFDTRGVTKPGTAERL